MVELASVHMRAYEKINIQSRVPHKWGRPLLLTTTSKRREKDVGEEYCLRESDASCHQCFVPVQKHTGNSLEIGKLNF